MGASGGSGGGGRADVGSNAPRVRGRTQTPLSSRAVDAAFARDRASGSGSRGNASVSAQQTPLGQNQVNQAFDRLDPGASAGPVESRGGTPLFLTPNGLLIPSSPDSQVDEEEGASTDATTPSQTGSTPRRRAASLLTLGLADTTRKSLLGRSLVLLAFLPILGI